MIISDLFETESNSIIEPLAKGYGSDEDDQTVLKLSDLRKTRLTLGQLNKLRILNDVKKLEHEQNITKLSKMYKAPASEDGGGMM